MKYIIFVFIIVLQPLVIKSQKLESAQVAELVKKYKTDLKGPYKDIRWFCKDGSTRPPKERCPEPGFQRARYKDEVERLAETNHIFLGQILSTTDFAAFLDKENNYSRLKQYMLGGIFSALIMAAFCKKPNIIVVPFRLKMKNFGELTFSNGF
ncbi:MAG: hypothetical protein R2759_03230 [Bacteroidales bacterium]